MSAWNLDLEVLSANRGSERESGDFTVRLATILPAGLGGEGGGSGWSLLTLGTRSNLVG
jgi:hypothetical protein